MSGSETYKELINQLTEDIGHHISDIQYKIRQYGSFNVIANSTFRNSLGPDYIEFSIPNPVIPEYVALTALKFPFSIGHREFSQTREVAKDLHEINELAGMITAKYGLIHHSKFSRNSETQEESELPFIAQMTSAYELQVRNTTFEDFHWDLVEELYCVYDKFLKDNLGFTPLEAIRICETIHDYVIESMQEAMQRCRKNIDQMYEEIIAYKRRGKKPKNFYPDEVLLYYKTMKDHHIRIDFEQSMQTYEMVIMGDTLSFTAQEIADMEELDLATVSSFLNRMSLNFGDVNPDFSTPEILHPLKTKPLIHHDGRFLCPSFALLDYSLDLIFSQTLQKETKKKLKDRRHDYLLEKGMGYLTSTMKPDASYTNLKYGDFELDGLIFCDSNIFFIEAKAHKITDRAKQGYIDRIGGHIKDVISGAYSQAIRTFNYLFGKTNVPFKDTKGKTIYLDGSKFHNAYFITLILEDFSAVSCSLKVNNSLGLFTKETFPWIVSLYDLRGVCDHMEGPAYLIQYLQRRKEFFQFEKFSVQDEMDILGYYLKRNLRFDEFIKKNYDKTNIIHLESLNSEFERYYASHYGRSKLRVDKMKHYSIQPIKNLVMALEESGHPYGKDAAVQVLEFSIHTKKELIDNIRKIRKMYNSDTNNHDFRIGGTDVNKKTWMFSYWVGPDEPVFLDYFEHWVSETFKKKPVDRYIAILDTGKTTYGISRILNLQTSINYYSSL